MVVAAQLREAWEEKANRQAIQQYQKALIVWRQLHDESQMIEALRGLGAVYYTLSEFNNSLTFYERALTLNGKRNDAASRAETLNQMSTVYLYLSESKKALECAQQAFELFVIARDKAGQARSLNNIGDCLDWSGKKVEAFQALEQALAIAQEIKEKSLLAHIYLNLGYVHVEQGKLEIASFYFKRALPLWIEMNHLRGQALTLAAMGRVASHLGSKQESLNFYAQANPLFKRIGDRLWEATTWANSAYVYMGLGDFQRALNNYEKALEGVRAINYQQGIAENYGQLGEVYFSLGQYQKAMEYYAKGWRALGSLDLERSKSYALRNMGRARAALGEYQKAVAYYQEARPLFQKGKDKQGEAYLLNDFGDAYRALNCQEDATETYRQALILNQTVSDEFGESQTRYHLSLMQLERKNLPEARTQIESALSLCESLRAKVYSQELRTSYSASIYQYHQLQIEVLMSLHRQQPAQGYDALSLAASERSRARSMLELLTEAHADLRQGIEPELVQRERTLRQQLNGKAERLMRLNGGTTKSKETELAAVDRELTALTAQHDDVLGLMRARNPRYAALTQPQPLDVATIQKNILDDDTLLLEYALGEGHSYVWAVSKGEVASYELAGRAQIEQAARRMNDLIIARQLVPNETMKQRRARLAASDTQYPEAAADLSRLILAPLAERLGNKRLIVVSEGALQYVPFAALPEPMVARRTEAEKPTPLIVQHEIISLPSASTLAVLRNETSQRELAPKAIAVLADPVFSKDDERFRGVARANPQPGKAVPDSIALTTARAFDSKAIDGPVTLPRLPATHEEAEAILAIAPAGAVRVFEGFAVNRAFVTGPELSQYRIIHFATHGLLDSRPALSGVALSHYDAQGHPQDGILRLHDIFNLKLPAELVVLSACDTALGKDIKGEGLIALTRGFMYAGAPRVMASLWKVNDEATAEFMKAFYQRFFNEQVTPAAALRAAQLAMWRQGNPPFHWAAFVMQGEYQGSTPVRNH